MQPAQVIAVASDGRYGFSKAPRPRLRLIEGRGVEGDAHCGATVKHRSRVARDPSQPNLRQVHLLHAELLEELAREGFALAPGDLGENVTTRGLDLLGLPRGARLAIGAGAVVEITGLRNPCRQIEDFRAGLLARVLVRDGDALIRKTGVMGVVIVGGEIAPGDPIGVVLPAGERLPLAPV
jgi:MOSC domain-containing protein YiiM